LKQLYPISLKGRIPQICPWYYYNFYQIN